jgi:cytochrome c556
LTLALMATSAHAAETMDTRTPVALQPAERAFVLEEMRQYVTSLQAITDGLARGDADAVASAARRMGRGAMSGAPPGMMRHIPKEFRMLGMSVHTDFDRLADAADTGAAITDTLSSLSATLSKCVACHAAYRFETR